MIDKLTPNPLATKPGDVSETIKCPKCGSQLDWSWSCDDSSVQETTYSQADCMFCGNSIESKAMSGSEAVKLLLSEIKAKNLEIERAYDEIEWLKADIRGLEKQNRDDALNGQATMEEAYFQIKCLNEENSKRLSKIIQLRNEMHNNVKDTSEYKELQVERQKLCLETFKLREELETIRKELCYRIAFSSGDPYVEEKAKEKRLTNFELVQILGKCATTWEDFSDNIVDEMVIQHTAKEMEKLEAARLKEQKIAHEKEEQLLQIKALMKLYAGSLESEWLK